MIPEFTVTGLLPPGVHRATWEEVVARYGRTLRRQTLLRGLRHGLQALHVAGCQRAYLDGSFVTAALNPGDFDVCWEPTGVQAVLLDPVFLDMVPPRLRQKVTFGGEFLVSHAQATPRGILYIDFFQQDKKTGEPKGIIVLDPGEIP